MHTDLLRSIKRLGRAFGVEISRYVPQRSVLARLQTILKINQIDMILDVGANIGQFALDVRSINYRGLIISFEPLSDAYEQLVRNKRGDSKWIIPPRVAIGNKDGEIEINVSGNSLSSSILPMLNSHLDSAPESRYIGKDKVKMVRLDDIVPQYFSNNNSIFLKIDTQGYELMVLEGATEILPSVRVIQIELSLLPLYEGQPLIVDMIKHIEGYGFVLYGINPMFTDNETGRLLQVDGIFVRPSE